VAQEEPASDTGQNFCTSCGRSRPQSALFCPHCGHRTGDNPAFCSHCGSSITAGASFCPSCGAATVVATVHSSGRGAIGVAETEYMGFWIRLAAAVIDGVLTGIIGGIIGALTDVVALGSVFSLLYYVLFTGLKGQTPGKMALRIQVVNQQGKIPGIDRAAFREIIGKLVSTVVILLGFFWIGWDRHKRGWHDHISGTYVVRKQRNRE
jgi:uncharacterized RDD family membrane protein YckC/RNA polymerase subunit RPABC4/transcription elongation factor Spt4